MPWWTLNINDETELTQDERQYIADLIVNGYTSGELVRDETEKDEPA